MNTPLNQQLAMAAELEEMRTLVKRLALALAAERPVLTSVVFWMDDLLCRAREVQQDLMGFYAPEKGWPPHIKALIAPTDYDTVLEDAKRFIAQPMGEHGRVA